MNICDSYMTSMMTPDELEEKEVSSGDVAGYGRYISEAERKRRSADDPLREIREGDDRTYRRPSAGRRLVQYAKMSVETTGDVDLTALLLSFVEIVQTKDREIEALKAAVLAKIPRFEFPHTEDEKLAELQFEIVCQAFAGKRLKFPSVRQMQSSALPVVARMAKAGNVEGGYTALAEMLGVSESFVAKRAKKFGPDGVDDKAKEVLALSEAAVLNRIIEFSKDRGKYFSTERKAGKGPKVD